MTAPTRTSKRCPDCNAERPASEFGPNRSARDGMAAYCRDHQRERNRASMERRRARIKAGIPPATRRRGATEQPVAVAGKRPTVIKTGLAGAERPIGGEPTFTITLTCSGCSYESQTTHPPADDPQAFGDMWRRVEQALHHDTCTGALTATVGEVDDRPAHAATPTPRRSTSNAALLV